ncbi:hypothetical protein PG985_007938 [Apiospora marii]|uniref:uncharacterized protein n=1 Tax=Apiospora marii TaxID=335849 RepID=UPI00312D8788
MADKSSRTEVPWAAKHHCSCDHDPLPRREDSLLRSEDPRLPQWRFMRLPECYKGLGAVKANNPDFFITYPVGAITQPPPVEWSKAYCTIEKTEFTGALLRAEADYIVVRPTRRVNEAVQRAANPSIFQWLLAPLIEAWELWKDFRVATEGRREVRRVLAHEAQLDYPRRPDSKLKYYAWFRRDLPGTDRAMIVSWQQVQNPSEFHTEVKAEDRISDMPRKL